MKLRPKSALQLLPLVFALVMVAAACGSDSDDATDAGSEEDSSESATTEAETTTTEAETTTTEAETTTTEAETTTTEAETTVTEAEEGEAAPGDGVPIELGEWFISEPGELTAGPVTFSLSNTGENPHAFAIARGTSYEELPQLENGAVDTDALGDDFLGAVAENIESGSTGSIDFDLEAGDYVFFCPVQFGPNSHAAAGQVLSVTVG